MNKDINPEIFRVSGSTYVTTDGNFVYRKWHSRMLPFLVTAFKAGKLKTINGVKIHADVAKRLGKLNDGFDKESTMAFECRQAILAKHNPIGVDANPRRSGSNKSLTGDNGQFDFNADRRDSVRTRLFG